MIEQAFSLDEFTLNDALAVKLRSLSLSYGFEYPFCTFWLQKSGGEITAAVCKYYSAVTVSAADNADFAELREFVSVIGFGEITAPFLPDKASYCECSEVFAAKKNISPNFAFLQPNFSDYRAIYDIFSCSESGAITVGSFDDWYVDINHRVRHNAARLLLVDYAAAVLLFDGFRYYLGGVAVSKHFRGQGKGSELIESLSFGAAELYTVFLAAERGFYEKCGFEPCGKYYYCTNL